MPTTELILIIEPDFAFNIGVATAFVMLKTDFILVFITLSKSSSDIRINKPSLVIPALFTNTSMLPKSSMTSLTSCCAASKSDASDL